MNEELNKKLAEWRFPDADTITIDDEHIFIVFRDTFRKRFGNEVIRLFTCDETACFKWLVPKLYGYTMMYPSVLFDKPTCYASAWKDENTPFTSGGKTPALALCKAIEKLIDGEK